MTHTLLIPTLLAAAVAALPAPAQPASAPTKEDAKHAATPALADPLTVFATTTPTLVTDALTFAEGPLWHDGTLFVCDLAGDTVFTISPREDDPATPDIEAWAAPSEFRKPSGRAAGSAVDAEGRLLLAAFTGTITRTEKDGAVTTIAKEATIDGSPRPLARCNDLAVHPDGTIFFTDFGKQSSESKGLFCIRPDGTVAALDADFGAANGVALSPDAATLYVNDYAKNLVIAYDCGADASVTNRRVFADLNTHKAGGRCDGLKAHADGRVFTTGPGGVWVFTKDATPLTRLDLEGGASNLCFGGKEGRTMFITTGKRVLRVDLVTLPFGG
jgi:gluconolactonase